MGNCLCHREPKVTLSDISKSEVYNVSRLTSYSSVTPEEHQDLLNIADIKRTFEYENLVLEGGGVKGIAYCGVLQVLSQKDILKNIKNFAGSSAGAIFAALIAIGYTYDELIVMVNKTDFNSFIEHGIFPFNKIEDIMHAFTELGCDSGSTFEKFMEKYIEEKTGNATYTFKQLYNDRNINLVITGTDINREMTLYFNYKSHPNMPIKEAVRISMSIPILFKPVKHFNDLCVDGGMLDNYPLHVFDGAFPGDPQAVNNMVQVNPKTLGIKLMTTKNTENMTMVQREEINDLKSFIIRMIDTLYNANERKHITPTYWHRSVIVNVPNIPITQFDVSSQQKNTLIKCGYDSCNNFFK